MCRSRLFEKCTEKLTWGHEDLVIHVAGYLRTHQALLLARCVDPLFDYGFAKWFSYLSHCFRWQGTWVARSLGQVIHLHRLQVPSAERNQACQPRSARRLPPTLILWRLCFTLMGSRSFIIRVPVRTVALLSECMFLVEVSEFAQPAHFC